MLDFVVIGAQKSGTTSLWRGIDAHPAIRTPADKERGFFNSDGRFAKGIERYVAEVFPDAGDALLGTVTPGYMMAEDVPRVVPRMASTCPDVKLIAILRDPIERAVSGFRQALRSGQALAEDFAEHLQLLGEREGVGNEPVLRAGEYGLILGCYMEHFARKQLLVIFTEDLDRDWHGTLSRVFAFLGVEPFETRPVRTHVSGNRHRVHDDALAEVEAEAMRRFGDGEQQRGFAWWLRHVWNTEPDRSEVTIPRDLLDRLEERYRLDAHRLIALGITPPWLTRLTAFVSP